MALFLGACGASQTDAQRPRGDSSENGAGPALRVEGEDIPKTAKDVDAGREPLSDRELAELAAIVRASYGEDSPFSACQRGVSLGLWSDRVNRSKPHLSEEALHQLERAQDAEPRATEMLAREYFELSQAALRELLVDALQPERREPSRTRTLLTRFSRSSDRAEAALARAADLEVQKAPEYAYQLALLNTQNAQWERAARLLRSLLERNSLSPSVASRAQLLLGIAQLALFPKEPDRALSHFVSVDSAAAPATGAIVLASFCYRGELAASKSAMPEAISWFEKIRDAGDDSALDAWAERRLAELRAEQ